MAKEVEKITSLPGPSFVEQYGHRIAQAMFNRTIRPTIGGAYYNLQALRQLMVEQGMTPAKFGEGFGWLKSGHYVIKHQFDKDAYTLSSTGVTLGESGRMTNR